MFIHSGKIAAVVRSGEQMRYLIVDTGQQPLSIIGVGQIDYCSESEASSALLGCRCIYGVPSSEFTKRRLSLPGSDDDPGRVRWDWELAQTSVEALDYYEYEYFRQGASEAEAWMISRERTQQIADWFPQRRLVLDRVVFVPDAIVGMLQPLIKSEFSVLIFDTESTGEIYLFHHQRLLTHAAITTPFRSQSSSSGWRDEVGVLLMNHFGGRQTPRTVELFYPNGIEIESVADALVTQLPYEVNRRAISAEALDLRIASGLSFDLGLAMSTIALIKAAHQELIAGSRQRAENRR